MSDRRAFYVFSALGLEQALDVLTTKAALSTGGAHEANPWAAQYVGLPTPVLLAAKVGLCLVGYFAWRYSQRRTERRTGRTTSSLALLPLLCLTGLYAYVLTSNVAIYLATRT